jgi:hypothetical protein
MGRQCAERCLAASDAPNLMPVKFSGVGAAAAAGGALLLYSAINGKSFSGELKSLLTGASPAAAPSANLIDTTLPSSGSASLSTGGTVVTPSSGSETAWIIALLSSIGAPSTQANINSISSWIAHEGPYGTQGANNPLNTTIETSGYTGKFAGTPVSNFDNAADGIAGTVATLLGGYPDILAALRSGVGLCGNSSVSADLHKWSGGGYSQVC